MSPISPSRVRVLRALDGQRSIRALALVCGGVTANAIHQHLRGARKDGLARPDRREQHLRRWSLTPRGLEVMRALETVGM